MRAERAEFQCAPRISLGMSGHRSSRHLLIEIVRRYTRRLLIAIPHTRLPANRTSRLLRPGPGATGRVGVRKPGMVPSDRGAPRTYQTEVVHPDLRAMCEYRDSYAFMNESAVINLITCSCPDHRPRNVILRVRRVRYPATGAKSMSWLIELMLFARQNGTG